MNKFKDFEQIFGTFDDPVTLAVSEQDLDEIDASAEEVIVHKATAAGERVLASQRAVRAARWALPMPSSRWSSP